MRTQSYGESVHGLSIHVTVDLLNFNSDEWVINMTFWEQVMTLNFF
jgi:hypothetical protein